MTTVLSIQSSVAFGHVGNRAAVFPLQRLGTDVVAVDTVHFSNHPGYGQWRGSVVAADEVREVITGVDEVGGLLGCDAVLSGYLGRAEVGRVVLDAVARVRAANPGAVFCCDPVLGDTDSGVYVGPGIPEVFRDEVVPRADVVTPNHFELDLLTGRRERSGTLTEVLAAADELRALGPGTVLVTSLVHDGLPEDRVETLAVDAEAAWLVSTPLVPVEANGSGDLAAALFLAHLLATRSTRTALERTTSSVHAVLTETAAAGARELRIVAAQEAIADPVVRFPARRLR